MSLRRGVKFGCLPALVLWAVIIFIVCLILSGCTTTGPVIGPCPPDRCVGPYDLTLSSHREALTDGL